MPKRTCIGDVFEIRTPAELAYVQYTHDHENMGELVRVLPGLYSTRPDISALAQQKERYFVFYTLKPAIRQKQVEFVSHEPVPDWAKPFPIMRHYRLWDNSWEIGVGNQPKTQRVKELTPEQRKLSISSLLVPHPAMVRELAQGWLPEDEVGCDLPPATGTRAKSEELKSTDEISATSGRNSLDHFLYFPRKDDADQAAENLRGKGWTVEMKQGSDGRNWLVLAKQQLPMDDDISDIRAELERLAAELGGEYDGWGGAV